MTLHIAGKFGRHVENMEGGKEMTNELKVVHEQELLGQGFKIYGSKEEPLFLAKDVAQWIEYDKTSVSKMINTVDEEEKLNGTVFLSGQKRIMWFLTEDGLYEVLMQSRKPIAKQFKKKVKEILKDIRNHGMYMNDNLLEKTLEDPMFMIGLLTNYNDEKKKRAALEVQNKELSEKIIEAKPKLDMYDAWLDVEGHCSIGEFARRVGLGRNTMFEKLRQMKILMNKGVNKNLPYQRFMKYFKIIDTVKGNNSYRVSVLNKEGCVWLHKKLQQEKEKLEPLESDYVADQKIGLK